MAKASSQDIMYIKNKLIQTMLDMAAAHPWGDITFAGIIETSGCDEATATALYDSKMDILSLYHRQVDLQLQESMTGAFLESDNEKDRIFDTVMERFDILNENRAAMLSILNALTLDPKHGLSALPQICASIDMIADVSGVDTHGWKGAARITALSLLYIKVLRDWAMDNGADMAATMASLDKALGYYYKAMRRV